MKTLIENTLWHTGSNGDAYAWNEISAKNFYEMERGNLNGKVCASGSICNDGVERTTQWVGKIGLMYPSDYGYSTSGGDEIDRSTCIATFLYNWTDSPDCYNHSWLYNHGFAQWSMTPAFYPTAANRAFGFFGDVPGAHYGLNDHSGAWSRPVVYLNSKVRIINGEGTVESPFEFSL